MEASFVWLPLSAARTGTASRKALQFGRGDRAELRARRAEQGARAVGRLRRPAAGRTRGAPHPREPGIGKTMLWREGVALLNARESACSSRGARRPRCRSRWARSRTCSIPSSPRSSDELVEPQRRALAAALGIETDRRAPRPAHACYVRSLPPSERSPRCAIAPGDRRRPVARPRVGTRALVRRASHRRGADRRPRDLERWCREPDPLGLADAFQPGTFAEITVGPLGNQHLQQLLRQRFDVRIPRSKVAAVHTASRGNPMFALEFARAAEREHADVRAHRAGAVVARGTGQRAGRGASGRNATAARARLGDRAPDAGLAREGARGSRSRSPRGRAVSAGAIAVGNDGVVRFTHPLLGAAVYFGMSPGRRRALHLDVAGLVDDLEQQARHLALARRPPDEAIADVVERAAEAAAARGAPDAAALLAAEAERLTPLDDETARVRRTFAGAGYLMEAGSRRMRGRGSSRCSIRTPARRAVAGSRVQGGDRASDRAQLRAYLREAIDIAPDPRVRWQAWMRYAQQGGLDSARFADGRGVGARGPSHRRRAGRSPDDRGGDSRPGLLRGQSRPS